jgi:excinuclease ABC subunit C
VDGPTDNTAISFHIKDLSLEEKLESLPQQPGVYQYKNAEGKVIYVGKAANLRSRVRQYFQKSRTPEPRLESMIAKITDVELVVTGSEVEALILEANLIKKLKPRYNVVLKDDKSYPYIVITNEPFPRVLVTRRKIPGGKYFGPYADVKTMRFALKTVRDIFMIRSCNYDLREDSIAAGKFKLCLDYHIHKCEGPCEALVSAEHYNKKIAQATQVLRGKTEVAVQSLEEEMRQLSEQLRFEDAGRVRDQIKALAVYTEKQRVVASKQVDRDIVGLVTKGDDACGVIFKVREGKVVGSQHFYLGNVEGKETGEVVELLLERYYMDAEDIPQEIVLSDAPVSVDLFNQWLRARRGEEVVLEVPQGGDKAKLVSMTKNNAQYWLDELGIQRMKRGDFIPHSLKSLQRDLRLENLPKKIECFDNSNIQGSDPVSSLVVFEDAKPKKSEYRKYKVKSVVGPDDFASMKEVVERRYSRMLQEQAPLPDLIVVDGGKGQLSSAVEVLQKLGIANTPIIGLAKRLEEVFVPGQSEPVQIPKTSTGLRLLQQIRDEAHRFAITFHRQLRSKRILQTELDLIQGIGKKRAQELLEAFGSVQGVKFAAEEQLAEIVGDKVASKIKEYFGEERSNDE